MLDLRRMFDLLSSQRPWIRYATAVGAVFACLLLRELLSPVLGHEYPYLTVWLGILFGAWCCGLGPSIAAALVGILGVWYHFLPPNDSFGLRDRMQVVGLVISFALASIYIAVGEGNRRTLMNRERAERDLRASEHRVRESEEQFRTLANSIPELCWMAHGDGHIFWYNERWFEYTGTVPSQMEGWGWQSVHDPQILPSVLEKWKECILAGQHFEMEFPLRGADGVFRWFLTRIRPVRDANGRVIRWCGVNTNIQEQREIREALDDARQSLKERVQARTLELKQANDSLRELSGLLLQMQDDERRRIARELHDSIGQLLAAIGMNLGMLQTQELDSVSCKLVNETKLLLDQVSRETRTISHLLHPPLLDETGLASALGWYIEGFSERSNVNVSTEITADVGRLSKEMELAIFRIVQECLTNIHRHSGSATAAVRITASGGQIELEIKDSGKGIPLVRQLELGSQGRTGVGFRGMRERVRQLGGRLEIQSDSHGTAVKVTLPLKQPAESLPSQRAS